MWFHVQALEELAGGLVIDSRKSTNVQALAVAIVSLSWRSLKLCNIAISNHKNEQNPPPVGKKHRIMKGA